MSEKENKEYAVKIILLGEMSVGKTSLINVYLDENRFNPNEMTSSRSSQNFTTLEINNITLEISLWDTMGQEAFRSVTKNFIKGSNIVILVYDITNRVSFLELNYWLNVSREELQNDAIFGIVGNKIDLFNNCEIEAEEGEKFANKIGALFVETSAKDNPIGFRDFVKKLLEKLISDPKMIQNLEFTVKEREKSIQLVKAPKTKKKKCC